MRSRKPACSRLALAVWAAASAFALLQRAAAQASAEADDLRPPAAPGRPAASCVRVATAGATPLLPANPEPASPSPSSAPLGHVTVHAAARRPARADPDAPVRLALLIALAHANRTAPSPAASARSPLPAGRPYFASTARLGYNVRAWVGREVPTACPPRRPLAEARLSANCAAGWDAVALEVPAEAWTCSRREGGDGEVGGAGEVHRVLFLSLEVALAAQPCAPPTLLATAGPPHDAVSPGCSFISITATCTPAACAAAAAFDGWSSSLPPGGNYTAVLPPTPTPPPRAAAVASAAAAASMGSGGYGEEEDGERRRAWSVYMPEAAPSSDAGGGGGGGTAAQPALGEEAAEEQRAGSGERGGGARWADMPAAEEEVWGHGGDGAEEGDEAREHGVDAARYVRSWHERAASAFWRRAEAAVAALPALRPAQLGAAAACAVLASVGAGMLLAAALKARDRQLERGMRR